MSNVLIPLGALLISIFIPLKIPKRELFAEMKSGSAIGYRFFQVWYFLLKYLVPLAIIVVLPHLIGVLSF